MATKRSTKLSGRNKTIIPDYSVSTWEGLNTYIKDLKQLSDGQSPDSLNWLTGKYKDHIELRPGYNLLGKTRQTGLGRVSGLGVAEAQNGTMVPFFTFNQKIMYYNATTGDTQEVNTTNVLPAASSGEDQSVMPYANIAGSWVYFTSPNSSIYKIHVSDPGDVRDLLSTAFRGNAKIDNNRMFLWNRKDNYRQQYQDVLYAGVSDKSDISQYTQTTGENAGGSSGDGSTKTFTGTLALSGSPLPSAFNTEFAAPIAAGVTITAITAATQAVVTTSAPHGLSVGNAVIINSVVGMTQINKLIAIVMAVGSATSVTLSINSSAFTAYGSAGTIFLAEYFIDDLNGGLNSINGGTGTINYTTGAYSLTFNTAPINAQQLIAQYYTDVLVGSVADFTINGSVQGQGKSFQQMDGGGSIKNVFPFDQVQYCFHELKTWYLTLTTNDTQAVNLPYRSQLGMSYLRGGFPTDDGIVFLDFSNPAKPQVQVLTIDNNSATAVITVVPNPLSEMLDLSTYGFSKVAIIRWGDYDIMACAGNLNGIVQTNNVVCFVRNIFTDNWDLTDLSASCFANWNGQLLAGDALSNNVFSLFTGFDDDGALINNHWTSKMFNLGVEGIKKTNRFVMKGLIQQTQNIDVYFSFDSGAMVKLCTVQGNASYVNLGNPTTIGSNTPGFNVIGGGGGLVTAYPYEVEFTIASDIYEYAQVQFQANNIGYASIDEFIFKDNRYKGRKLTPSRVVVI